MGLLLLRALLGLQLTLQGVAYTDPSKKGLLMWLMAGSAFGLGALLLSGLITPVASILIALGGFGVLLSIIPLPSQSYLCNGLTIISFIVQAVSLATLGPGAFSLDARMFGRREITIPSSPNTKS
ncbi:MAG TPA: hypothetical protein VI306_22810 [Pyrinomonadaceae bacterium]